jgi:hypothetical protein
MRSDLLSSSYLSRVMLGMDERGSTANPRRKAGEKPETATDAALQGGDNKASVKTDRTAPMLKSEHELVAVLKVTMEVAENVESRVSIIATAVLAYIKERGEQVAAKPKNGSNTAAALTLDMTDLREHCFELVGYAKGSNPSFEQAVRRGCQRALLVYEGFKGCKLGSVGKKAGLVAPSCNIYPKIKTIDPVSGKAVGEVDNQDKTLVLIPASKEADLFAEAFPGRKRKARTKDTGTTATPTDGNKVLDKFGDADVFITARNRARQWAKDNRKFSGTFLEVLTDLVRDLSHVIDLSEEEATAPRKAVGQ